MTDRQLIETAARELATRHGFSDAADMRQRDLEYCCTRIEESSGILISLSTVKRIINGQYNRLPQVATLNAIAIFLGYADWQAFKTAKSPGTATPERTSEKISESISERASEKRSEGTPERLSKRASEGVPERASEGTSARTPERTSPQIPHSLSAPGPSPVPSNRHAIHDSRTPIANRTRRTLLITVIIAFIILALLSFNYFIATPAGTGPSSFSIRRTTPSAIPNTVVFTYDIDHLHGDSFFIQQSWDRHRRVRIYKGSHTLTDVYYEPGYHTAKLIADNKIVKTIGVSIPTDSWFFYGKPSLNRSLDTPAYIHTATPIRNGILGLEKQDLTVNRVDPDKPLVYLYNYFPSAIAVDADNFRLQARVRMEDVRNTACPFIMPEVFVQHGLMFVETTPPGCTGSIGAQFGNQFLDGRNTDLSPLACDVHAWHEIQLLVRQKRVTITVDGRVVLKSEYTTSAGQITGLGFHSNGLCKVDSIHLAGLDGTVVYPFPATIPQ